VVTRSHKQAEYNKMIRDNGKYPANQDKEHTQSLVTALKRRVVVLDHETRRCKCKHIWAVELMHTMRSKNKWSGINNMKVAIYARVSTEEQDANKQILICREYCERMGFEVFKEYEDVISGTKFSRPEFNTLLADMRSFRFRAVVITKLDRIGRSLKHLISLIEELQAKKVELIAVTQNIDTTSPTGKLQWQIMGAFAEFEREIISQRTKEGLRFAKNVGKRGKDKKPRQKRGVLRK